MSYADTLRRVMDADYADASAEDKANACRELVTVCSVAAGAVALQPIPLLDAAIVLPIQIGMVQGVGRVHGYTLDRKSVIEILGTFGAGLVAQNIMMATAKMIPFFGWIASAAMSYALTWAIGEVAEHYFRSGRGMSQDDLRSMFKETYAEKRAEREQALKRAPSLKERLEQLEEAKKAGLIDEEEYLAKKQAILAAL